MRAVLLTAMLGLATVTALAQDDDLEYKMDFGGGVGVATPIGDTGGMFSTIGPAGQVVLRRTFNPRMALKFNLAAMRLSGQTDGYFPTDPLSQTPEGGLPATQSWKRAVIDFVAMYEQNFWGFGSGPKYKGNKRVTPYIAAGAGLTLAVGNGTSAAGALNLPVAIGVKYKLKPRLNLELEWRVHFTTTDRIDATPSGIQLNDPYGIESGMMKNKDCYSTITVSLTYDACPKLRKCNN